VHRAGANAARIDVPAIRVAAIGLIVLENEWRAGELDYNGLVLAEDLCQHWRSSAEWAAFRPGHRWLPYSGSKNI